MHNTGRKKCGIKKATKDETAKMKRSNPIRLARGSGAPVRGGTHLERRKIAPAGRGGLMKERRETERNTMIKEEAA